MKLQVLLFKMVQVSIFMFEKDMSGFSREQFPLRQEVNMLDMQSPTLQVLLLVDSVFPMTLYNTKSISDNTESPRYKLKSDTNAGLT